VTAAEFLVQLDAGLSWMTSILGPIPVVNDAARLCLLVFAGQETGWNNVAQEDGGPGRGPWQDEPETIYDVLHNVTTQTMALKLCAAVGIKTAAPIDDLANEVYDMLMANPHLAAGFNRCDLYADDHPLPTVGDEAGCLACYTRVWRPAWTEAPNSTAARDARARFSAVYKMSLAAIQQGSVA
jgi:hypothetical protein